MILVIEFVLRRQIHIFILNHVKSNGNLFQINNKPQQTSQIQMDHEQFVRPRDLQLYKKVHCWKKDMQVSGMITHYIIYSNFDPLKDQKSDKSLV